MNRLNRFRKNTLTRKLKELQTLVDTVKVGKEELAVWTDGSSEVIVMLEEAPNSVVKHLMDTTLKVFGLGISGTDETVLPSTFISQYRDREDGYYVERGVTH